MTAVRRLLCAAVFALIASADAALAAASVPPQQMRDIRADPFIVRYRADDERLARRVARAAQQGPDFPGIPREYWATTPIVILLAPDEQHLLQFTGGRIPEWGAGAAIPQRSLIILPGYESERGSTIRLGTILRHEIAHIAVYRAGNGAPAPLWFTEGYATWSAGQLDFEAGWLLRIAFATGRAPPLDSLELAWPRLAGDARLAYLLSASAIDYLYRASGEAGLRNLFYVWRTSGNFNTALIRTYGADLNQIERYWRNSVRRRYGWFAILTQSVAYAAALTILAGVLWFVRRRRDRQRWAALRASEIPDEPAFWRAENAVDIIAHRGYSARAPENTRAAIDLAIRVGARSVEFDVHATRDGVPVVIHDYTLERTTNGTGRVAALTFDEIRRFDAGSWFSPEYAGEKVPSLEEVLDLVRGRVDRVYIEMKPNAFRADDLNVVVQQIVERDMLDNAIIMSFDWKQLHYIRTLPVTVTLAFLADDEEHFMLALGQAQADGNAIVDCNYQILLRNRSLAERAHAMGIGLAVYTVNEPSAAAALVERGVRRLTTNEVERLLKWAVDVE